VVKIIIMRLSKKYIWDYDIKNLDLSKKKTLLWYLQRKIEYGDWESIDKKTLKKYLKEIKIDPILREILKSFVYEK
jgi:hypothetical protein